MKKKQRFKMIKNVGDIYCFGARKFGKSLVIEKLDLIVSMLIALIKKNAFSSVDLIHLRAILDDIKVCFQNHPICSKWERRITGAPDYKFELKNNFVINSVNFNLGAKSPGRQWLGKHVEKVYIEEACFSGRSRIRCQDLDENSRTLRLSEIINNNLKENLKVLSYNIKEKKLEFKKINNVFKKTVLGYEYYKIGIFSWDKNTKRVLESSQNQKFWTCEGYKDVSELKVGDSLYTMDHQTLNSVQENILIGTLLGDAYLTKTEQGQNPSLSFCHGESQSEYIKYKHNIFKNIFDGGYRSRVKYEFKETEFKGHVARITSRRTVDLNRFKNLKNKQECKVKELSKYFNKISLAFWIMDDGSLQFPRGKTFKATKYLKLHTEGFNFETCQALSKMIFENLQIISEVKETNRNNKTYYQIHFDYENTLKVISLVQPYIHPTMYYKIYHPTELCKLLFCENKPEFNDLSNKITDNLQPCQILDIQRKKPIQWTMYDIEVEDNHNFFANGILVHNSLETEEVYDKRKDALSEDGAVFRVSGMTDFSTYSPAYKAFTDPKRKKFVLNLPQYVNPTFDLEAKLEKIEEYGGIETLNYKIYVGGEIVEDSISAFDMARVRNNCYLADKKGNSIESIKKFEITKDNYPFYENLIIVERPKNADRIFIDLDVGEKVTEIIVHAEIGKKYKYLYNITLYNQTHTEVLVILKYLCEKLSMNVLGIDCGDGEGRVIYRECEKIYPKENLVWYDGSQKIEVGFETDENNNIKKDSKTNEPIVRKELMSEWSVTRLKELLYEGRYIIPDDSKFDTQFTKVVSIKSGQRRIYKCINAAGDHLFDAWRVLAIAQWLKVDFNATKPVSKPKSTGASNW